jgi:hypothetical protein
MKQVILRYVDSNIDKFDVVDPSINTHPHAHTYLHSYIFSDPKREKKARIRAYLHAYEKSIENSAESEVLLEQALRLMSEKSEEHDENDPIMQKINDVDELAAPRKVSDSEKEEEIERNHGRFETPNRTTTKSVV